MNNVNPALSALIEDEVRIRVARELDSLNKEAERIRAKQAATELDLAIARWAIAGILSRNLHTSVTVDPTQAADIPQMMRLIGESAGESFVYHAELQFKQHAEHSELLARTNKAWQPHISTERGFETQRAHWPKP